MQSCADRYVHYLAEQSTPIAMSTEEIQEHSKTDRELIQVRQCIEINQPHKLPPQYKTLEQELSIVDNIILRGNRIILPTKLQSKAIKLAHNDHAGMTKSKLWWPNMDKNIEQYIRTCHPCQIVEKPDRPEPVQHTKLPDEPWGELTIDS
jgi:erythromycin esterase-like protein